jgi:hypothetical protein
MKKLYCSILERKWNNAHSIGLAASMSICFLSGPSKLPTRDLQPAHSFRGKTVLTSAYRMGRLILGRRDSPPALVSPPHSVCAAAWSWAAASR